MPAILDGGSPQFNNKEVSQRHQASLLIAGIKAEETASSHNHAKNDFIMIDTTSAAARQHENVIRKLSSPVKLENSSLESPLKAISSPLNDLKPEEKVDESCWEDIEEKSFVVDYSKIQDLIKVSDELKQN